MTNADSITDFKLRTDLYETPTGTYTDRALAVQVCERNDFSPELCITHKIEMSSIQSLLDVVNLHCGKLAEESDFTLSHSVRYTGRKCETLIPEK